MLAIFAKSTIIEVWSAWMDVWSALITPLPCSNAGQILTNIYEYMKQFWRHQLCKLNRNITSALVFMAVFGIHCNFFIVLPIWLKACRSNDFLLFTRQNVRARKIGHVSEVLRAWARPIGIGRTICPNL